MDELIADLKALGFMVYGPERLTTYVWFTDGVRIGYAQRSNDIEGVRYTTVHKANRHSGTGFTAGTPQEALSVVPHWWTGPAPTKYKDFETFRKQNWQPLVQY